MFFFGPDFVTVTKTEDAEFRFLKPFVFSAMMEFFGDEKKPILLDSPENKDTAISENDSEGCSDD